MSQAAYFYRSKRDGNRVEREYVGKKIDPIVNLLWREDRLCKAEKEAYRRQRTAERDWYQQLDVLIDQRCDRLRDARDIWLIINGYRVSRNNWKPTSSRKLRERTVPSSMTSDDFDTLVKLSEQGDARARASLCELMHENRETFRPFGDLANHVQHQFLDMLTRGSVVARESLKVNLAEMKQRLSAGVDSPIRDLAVDQVVLTWLDMHYQALMSAEPREGKSAADHLERRLARSQKRYRYAVEFLGKIDQFTGSAQDPIR